VLLRRCLGKGEESDIHPRFFSEALGNGSNIQHPSCNLPITYRIYDNNSNVLGYPNDFQENARCQQIA
jgi:hypothetical protein